MISAKWLNGFEDLSDARSVRREVFIDEQGVPEDEEFDGTDADCMHLILYDGDTPVAAGRVLWDDEFGAIAKRLSRVAVENMGFDKLIPRYDGGILRESQHFRLGAFRIAFSRDRSLLAEFCSVHAKFCHANFVQAKMLQTTRKCLNSSKIPLRENAMRKLP